jgi:hypothetical protein
MVPFPKKLGFPLFLWFFYPLPEAEPRDKKLGFPRFYGFSDFFIFLSFCNGLSKAREGRSPLNE